MVKGIAGEGPIETVERVGAALVGAGAQFRDVGVVGRRRGEGGKPTERLVHERERRGEVAGPRPQRGEVEADQDRVVGLFALVGKLLCQGIEGGERPFQRRRGCRPAPTCRQGGPQSVLGLPEAGAVQSVAGEIAGQALEEGDGAREGISISLKTGAGLSMLQELLQQRVQQKLENRGDSPLLTRPRHRHALNEALAHLLHGLDAPRGSPELLAEDLRLAMRAIGRITGRVDVEELLDFVFRDFCIGK